MYSSEAFGYAHWRPLRNCTCGGLSARFDTLFDVEFPPPDSGSWAGIVDVNELPNIYRNDGRGGFRLGGRNDGYAMVSLGASGSWIVKSAQEINVCEKVVARNVRSILCGGGGTLTRYCLNPDQLTGYTSDDG